MGKSVRVDQKGRLKIPATLLTTLNQHGTEFYVTSENGDSVRIYPMPVWKQVEKRMRRLASRNRSNERLLALAKYFGSTVTVDRQGRVLIPIGLRKSTQMHGVVDVLDYLPYLEVWNHTRFLKSLRDSPAVTEDGIRLSQFISDWRSSAGAQTKKRFGMMHRLRRPSSRPAIRAI